MKYIDTDKLIAELTKMQFTLNVSYRKPQSDNIVRAISLEYDDILSLIDSLQQEQPSLPSDLDEAADTFNREDAARMWDYEGKTEGEIVEAAFKAGAEWMTGQGETVEGVFKAGDPGYPDVRMGEQYSIEHILCKPGGIEPGDEVVVQIRKK